MKTNLHSSPLGIEVTFQKVANSFSYTAHCHLLARHLQKRVTPQKVNRMSKWPPKLVNKSDLQLFGKRLDVLQRNLSKSQSFDSVLTDDYAVHQWYCPLINKRWQTNLFLNNIHDEQINSGRFLIRHMSVSRCLRRIEVVCQISTPKTHPPTCKLCLILSKKETEKSLFEHSKGITPKKKCTH